MTRTVHPIETRSYTIMRELVDLSHLPPRSRAVTERVIHATADLDWAEDLVLDEDALQRGRRSLRSGAQLVADVAMVAAGITSRPARVAIAHPGAAREAAAHGTTRTAAGVRVLAGEVGAGAVWVVGCAPTALEALLESDAHPALVVGLPVGFVGAVEAKQALRDSGLPAVSNRSAKGGAAVAAAALNALLYHSEERG